MLITEEILTSPEAVERIMRPLVDSLEDEHAYVLHLNNKRGLISGPHLHSIGSARFTLIDPIKVLRDALRDGAHAIIMVHNHPSGDPTPSDNDRRVTEVLATACKAVGLPLLDHVIIGASGGFHSMAEHYEFTSC